MLALIDLDPLPYAYGGVSYEDGTVLPDHRLRKMIDDRIQDIMDASGGTDWIGYLTDSPSNFRIPLATILPYKGNREGNSKPPKFQMLRDYLMDTYPDRVTMVTGMEADDALSIRQYEWLASHPDCCNMTLTHPSTDYYDDATVICTIDKDLMMVPGWHYNWQHDERSFVSELEGTRFFYKQLLTGDMTDNIRGLFGVGNKSALVKKLDDMDTEQDMFLHVQREYVKRFGNYADQFMLENGRLLWMLKNKDDMWDFPTIVREEEDDRF